MAAFDIANLTDEQLRKYQSDLKRTQVAHMYGDFCDLRLARDEPPSDAVDAVIEANDRRRDALRTRCREVSGELQRRGLAESA